jgi:hypothetical protein
MTALGSSGTPAGLVDLGAVPHVCRRVGRSRVRLGSGVECACQNQRGQRQSRDLPAHALLLLLVVRASALRHPPLFSIAVPLVVALALIRLCLYAAAFDRALADLGRAISYAIFRAHPLLWSAARR